MRILITGASGFLGSHVADRLGADGHELRLLLRPTSRVAYLSGLLDYERVDGDLRDRSSLARAVDGVETVVHLAALVASRAEPAADYAAVNADGTAALAQEARSAGVRRFVYISSIAARGPSPDGRPPPPDYAQPMSVYGRSKLAGEAQVLAAIDDMEVAVLRPPVVYGPRDRAMIPLYRIAKLGLFPVLGNGLNQLSIVHAFDAADAIAGVTVGKFASGSVYSFADGPPHTWRDLIEAFGAAIGRRPLIVPTPPVFYLAAGYAGAAVSRVTGRRLPLSPEQVRVMRQPYWTCDSEAITRDLGWKPKIGTREGMAGTVRWYKEQRWL